MENATISNVYVMKVSKEKNVIEKDVNLNVKMVVIVLMVNVHVLQDLKEILALKKYV